MNRSREVVQILPALTWMAIIFVLSSRPTTPDARVLGKEPAAILGHLFMYSVLASLLLFALARGRQPISNGLYVLSVALAVGYGVSDEIHQSFVPGRESSLFDVGIDAIGAAIAVVCIWWLTHQLQ